MCEIKVYVSATYYKVEVILICSYVTIMAIDNTMQTLKSRSFVQDQMSIYMISIHVVVQLVVQCNRHIIDSSRIINF